MSPIQTDVRHIAKLHARRDNARLRRRESYSSKAQWRRLCWVATLLLLWSFELPARAQSSQVQASSQVQSAGAPAATQLSTSRTVKERARRHFDRGLTLYDDGDASGALKEFRAAFTLIQHPMVLYNIARVYADLGDPVQCVRTVEQARTLASGVDAQVKAELDALYRQQQPLIAQIIVKTNVSQAMVQVDGLDVGQGLAVKVELSPGDHVVSTVATGYLPKRIRLQANPQTVREVPLSMEPIERALAHLSITANVPEVAITVDGDPVGVTPFPASIAFAPGRHEVVAERAGYVTVKREVFLDPGASGTLQLEMLVDSAAPPSAFGALALEVSEPDSITWINGQPGPRGSKVVLPIGRHQLRVQRHGFIDYAREVSIGPGLTATRVELLPDAEYLDNYRRKAKRMRTLGWTGVGVGTGVAAAAAAFLVYNSAEQRRAQDEFDAFADDVRRDELSRACSDRDCEAELRALAKDVDDVRARAGLGWIGVGVGGAAVVAGVALLLTGDDPKRYDPGPESDVFAKWSFEWTPRSLAVSHRMSFDF